MVKSRKSLLPRQKKPQHKIYRSQLYIRAHREARGMTLSELARQIGKTKGLVSQVETGFAAASLQTLEDIAEVFGLEHVGLLFEPPLPAGWVRVRRANTTSGILPG
jgi:transcriptional regulator with XRE-family HTH domain